MTTIITYVHWDRELMWDRLQRAWFSEDACRKGSYALCQLKFEIDFDDEGNVLDTRFIK